MDVADPDVPAGADAVTKSMIELKSGHLGRRTLALQRLQRSVPDGRIDQVFEVILPLLEDDDLFLVVEVVKTLAVWKSPEAMQGLIGRLRDNRHFVRSEAIKALGKYPELRAAEAVVTVMKEDGFAVEDALKAMGEVAEPALIPVLRNADSGLRRHACRILAQIGGQATLAAMPALPPDSEFSVRVATNEAMKQIVARVGPPPTRPARGQVRHGLGQDRRPLKVEKEPRIAPIDTSRKRTEASRVLRVWSFLGSARNAEAGRYPIHPVLVLFV